jgi:iron complex outermembrane receptor protein
VKTDNTFNFYQEYNGKPEMDLSRSNTFEYEENVNAAYVNYNRTLSSKWSLQAGLRAEQTNSKGDLTRADGQQQQDDNVSRHYFDLFPSGALTYTINPKHTLNLTYSRRINRPSYQDLNPFENKLDELTYEKGNAFLKPQYANNVELGHTFMGMVNTTIGYSHIKDYATQITDTANKNATYIQQRNLATQQLWSASIGSPFKVFKWWSGYVNMWYNYQMFKGKIGENALNVNYSMYGAYLQQSFTIGKKGTTAEISGYYNGPSVWAATWRIKPMYSFDIGVQQSLFNKKATLRVSLTDVLYSDNWRSDSDFGGLIIKGRGIQETRTVRIAFSYRFGSNEIKQSRERKTGLESEKGRIK